ncbi:nitroreductase/quinone reductase family protein [Pseudonocardia bannensis]|uniref:Nitroreductase family deazaflavin-dependent oxidoreductase n=1 Tax=Pseudonocardia bannensis TaxID=630973 RepID=A0A848DA91_9PSEU|nr:nitroreductase/quinone reductase family protein [Pseudonocardia bannensis]NMH90173.1 nitroreductase family deazaflavin-dependent oxidoreductase [Pseudonocardia bannensis]
MSNVEDRVMKAVDAVHRGIFRASRGRAPGRAGSMPVVELTTTGVGDGRERLWSRLTAAHANYAGYQRRTGRPIPVVVLDPVQGRDGSPPTVGA